MRTYMARLGGFQFGLDTAAFQKLQRTSTFSWQAKNRIGRQPAQQNTGRGADTIALDGVIFPHWRGGLGQMDMLRRMASDGDPFPLVYAFETAGQYCGLWCITNIEEERTVFFEDGTPRKIDFKLSLVEYGEDAGGFAPPIPALAGIIPPLPVVADVAEEAQATLAEAKTATTAATAMEKLGSIKALAENTAAAITATVDTVLKSDAVKLVREAKAQVSAIQSTVNSLKNVAKIIDGVNGDPLKAFDALGSVSQAAAGSFNVLGSTASIMLGASNLFVGGSANSLHTKQVGSAASELTSLASTSQTMNQAAGLLKGLL